MTERSSVGGSRMLGRGRRAEGLRAERYVFSDGFSTMSRGDQRTRRVYACVGGRGGSVSVSTWDEDVRQGVCAQEEATVVDLTVLVVNLAAHARTGGRERPAGHRTRMRGESSWRIGMLSESTT